MNKAVDALTTSVEAYAKEVAIALDTVNQLLSAGRFVDAYEAMNALTQRQAIVSLGMRRVLLRAGHIRDEDS